MTVHVAIGTDTALNTIVDACERMEELIEAMLVLSRVSRSASISASVASPRSAALRVRSAVRSSPWAAGPGA